MEKSFKKGFVLIALSMVTALLFFGCGGNQPGNTQNLSEQTQKAESQPADAINIDQITWGTHNVVVDKSRRLGFTYTNSSEYCIANLSLDFSVKDGATLDDIKPAFIGASSDNVYLAKGIEQVTEDNFKNLSIDAEVSIATYPGETSEQDLMSIGYDYLTNENQLEFFTPNLLTIKYVKDNKMYTETYDYLFDTYSLEDEVEEINEWPENEFTQILPYPESLLIESAKVSNGKFKVETIGTSMEIYEDYIEACKDAGFNKNIEESEYTTSFKATNSDNSYSIDTYIYKDHGNMTITVSKVKKTSKKSS